MTRVTDAVATVSAVPLVVPYKEPFHWAQGVIDAASVVLVEIKTRDGVVGYGECIGTPSFAAVTALIERTAPLLIGESVFDANRLMRRAYHDLFAARGTCSAPRFGAQVLAGLDMALWDAAGKTVDLPVRALMGGAVRETVSYFGFAPIKGAALSM